MVEKMIFNPSGLVKDIKNKEEIVVWGHDAGEFILEEVEEILEELVASDTTE